MRTDSSSVSQTEIEHCNELALLPGSLFEFTSRFVSADRREPLLALYALKQAVSTIPQAPVEDTVKWAKLKWWSEEFSADPVAPSRHPVLRVLQASGARRHLDNGLLQRLVRDAIMQIDVAPNSDENALFESMATMGATDIQLELALDHAEIETRDLELLGAATRLCRVISSFGESHDAEVEQIPLNLRAKYDIRLEEPDQVQNTEALAQLLGELAGKGLEWSSEGLAGLRATLDTGACRHLQLRLAMESRRLGAITRNANIVFDAHQHYGPGDAWFAWRFLRRLK